MLTLNNCIIIYGFTDVSQLQVENDIPILLVEPRKMIIDKIKSQLPKNVELIPKMLIKQNVMSEVVMYHYLDTKRDYYTIHDKNQEESTFVLKSKQKVYTTSLQNLIMSYKIRNIQKIVWNLNTHNIVECLDTLVLFSYFINKIQLLNDIDDSLIEKSQLLIDNFIIHALPTSFEFNNIHDNSIPRIVMFLTEPVSDKARENFELFKMQYNINVLDDIFVSNQKSGYLYEKFNNCYKSLFCGGCEDIKAEIVVQFNPRILEKNITFKINLTCDDKIMYIDKNNDLIYANKDTFYYLYEVINSEYFNEYIQKIKSTKKEFMFKLFNKRYFYEYIQTVFDVIEPLN